MSKYKVGDKVVMKVAREWVPGYANTYMFGDESEGGCLLGKPIAHRVAEPLSTYTEPLEAKIKSQAAEITRLLAGNKRLKAENGNSLWNIEQAKAEGQNEAWELARKIASTAGGLSSSELIEIFNSFLPRDILSENTYPEAAAKVSQWEKAKEEIKVGDVVENNVLRGERFIVTFTNGKSMSGVTQSGLVVINEKPKEWHKTGRHIDIDSFLKQIGEE